MHIERRISKRASVFRHNSVLQEPVGPENQLARNICFCLTRRHCWYRRCRRLAVVT